MSRLFLCALLLVAACRRPAGPDAHYQKAYQLHSQLYATQLDDAYGDPQMDVVVTELKQVNPRSQDADAAQAMLDSISRGKEALAKQRAEREKMAQVAAQNYAAPAASINPTAFLAAAAPDAGPSQDPYGEGADISVVNSQTGGCVTSYEPFKETGTNVTGTVYRLVDSEGCKSKLPGFVGQAVLVVNGKIYRRVADPQPPPPPKPRAQPDAGQPDAGQPKAGAPPPRPPAATADAGEPEYQIFVPGGPQPGAPPAEQPQQ